MEFCENSGLPIAMVPCLHQSNVHTKRKLRAWRAQKCILLVGSKTALPSMGLQTTAVHGGQYRPRMEICGNSGLPIAMVPGLHQSNVHTKGKLRTWRAQKCIPLVGSKTALISIGLQTTAVHGGQYRPRMEFCENSGLPIAMVPCLHQSNVHTKRKLRA